jgi:hypothetical protein
MEEIAGYAGRAAAALQTLLATARLHGLERLRWLPGTREKLPTCPNSQIDSLLPFAQSTQTEHDSPGRLAGQIWQRRQNLSGFLLSYSMSAFAA